jgi:hypothetical protein
MVFTEAESSPSSGGTILLRGPNDIIDRPRSNTWRSARILCDSLRSRFPRELRTHHDQRLGTAAVREAEAADVDGVMK